MCRNVAIYHLHQSYVSRSSGRSSVQSVAYIAREKLFEERLEKIVDYSVKREDLVCVKTLAPENCKYRDLDVWNEVEKFEDKYAEKHYKSDETIMKYKESAQTASTIILALPNELSIETNRELLERFIDTRFTSRGLVSTYAIHKNAGNLHAHIQTTRRAIDEETGEFCERKDRVICTKKALLETRKLWADLANEYLEREGCHSRINEKSFADLGVDLTPSRHKGWFGDSLGDKSRIVQENSEIGKLNREMIIENPESLVNLLNANRAVFTQRDILTELGKRLDSQEQIEQVFEKILNSVEYVGESARGEFLYTGKRYREQESETLTKFEELSSNKIRESFETKDFEDLSEEQKRAVQGLIQGDQIGVLVGKAGAGKTRTMAIVSEVYKRRGHRVVGMSLSAVASENLGKDADIESRTIASWTHCWRSYEIAKEKFLSFNEIVDNGILKQLDWYRDLKRYEEFQLKKGDVIIVDEAGMVGIENWNEILRAAEKFGAKVIAVGDSNQFDAISSGGCFRKFAEIARENGELFELNEIRRQREAWMKEASTEFSKLNTIEGLTKYENHGNIKGFETKSDLIKFSAGSYAKGDASIVLCHGRETCRLVNEEVRKLRREQGEIGEDIANNINGRNFAINDKVMFLQNDRNLGIKNGQSGVISEGNQNYLKIKIDGNQEIEIDTRRYDKLDYGYAITLYKSQGKTFDNVLVVAEKGMDAKATYVAMTRHRENISLLYSKADFKSFKMLSENLSKYRQKDLVADYQDISNENKLRVLEYQDSLIELSRCLNDINQGSSHWKEYSEIKAYSNELGKEIYRKYDSHKLYLDQAGITKEKLEIRLGIRKCPLTQVEINARDCVELYAKTALETRELFKSMKSEKFNVMDHESYGLYSDMRKVRNDLAREILSNYSLHKRFIREFAGEYYISRRTMEKQVDYAERALEKNFEMNYERFISELEFARLKPVTINYNWETVADKIRNAKSDPNYQEKLKEHEKQHGYPNYVDRAMVAAYSAMHGIDKQLRFAGVTDEYASMLVQKFKEQDKVNGEPTLEIIEKSIKQALCFEALKIAKTGAGRDLTPDLARELDRTSAILARHLSNQDMHLLNDKNLMKKASEALSLSNEYIASTNKLSLEHLVDLNQKEIVRIEATMAYKNVQKDQKRQIDISKSKGNEIEI